MGYILLIPIKSVWYIASLIPVRVVHLEGCVILFKGMYAMVWGSLFTVKGLLKGTHTHCRTLYQSESKDLFFCWVYVSGEFGTFW